VSDSIQIHTIVVVQECVALPGKTTLETLYVDRVIPVTRDDVNSGISERLSREVQFRISAETVAVYAVNVNTWGLWELLSQIKLQKNNDQLITFARKA
jgi:hypothetical protein